MPAGVDADLWGVVDVGVLGGVSVHAWVVLMCVLSVRPMCVFEVLQMLCLGCCGCGGLEKWDLRSGIRCDPTTAFCIDIDCIDIDNIDGIKTLVEMIILLEDYTLTGAPRSVAVAM